MKLLALADTHCGHLLGLTPPKYQRGGWKLSHLMSDYWDWFESKIKKVGKPDYAIWTGDIVDGEGKRDTSHHLTTDPEQQQDMAIDIIKMVGAKKNVFVYGTPYHTGSVIDYENRIAEHLGESISYKQKVNIGGVRFNIMHTTGKSGNPVGGDIGIKTASVWSLLYDLIDGREHADIVLRAHAHEYRHVGNELIKAFIQPALKIGKPDHDRYPRRLDGWYTVGFLEFDYKKGTPAQNVWPNLHQYKYLVQEGYVEI